MLLRPRLFSLRLGDHCSCLHYRLLVPVRDPTAGQVVWRHFYDNPIVWQNPDVVHPHLATNVSQNLMAIVELDPEHRIWQGLTNSPLHLDCAFFGHSLRLTS
jgi:hypothetical protein